MKKSGYSNFFSGAMARGWRYALIAGIAFLLFGIIVMIFPQILVMIVASVFMFIGIILLGVAINARNLEKMSGDNDIESWR